MKIVLITFIIAVCVGQYTDGKLDTAYPKMTFATPKELISGRM